MALYYQNDQTVEDERPSVVYMQGIRNLYKISGRNPEARITWGSNSRLEDQINESRCEDVSKLTRFRRGNACSGFITGKVLHQCLSTY
jgi:hypothetical protein